MMLDTIEAHRLAFPDPPVSRPKGAPVVEWQAPKPVPPRPRGDITTARLQALAGRPPLAPECIGRIWADAGLHASDPAAVLRYYNGTGAMVRVSGGQHGSNRVPSLYVVPSQIHNHPSAVAHPGVDHGSASLARPGEGVSGGKSSRPAGGGSKK